MNLDFMPSPVEDRPGLLIRDSLGYSDAVLIVPMELLPCLECFDGSQTALDLRQVLVQITSQLDVGEIQQGLIDTLSQAGFLHDSRYEEMRAERHQAFADAEVRGPVHAGTAYPENPEETRKTLAEYMAGTFSPAEGKLVGIAAPHVSPFGGWQTYQAAYSALPMAYKDRTFVVLGTSHYGPPDHFGLTRKPYVTPLGATRPDTRLIDELGRESAALMEDYSHSVEHSIEFQVLFLQHLFGADISVVPILCGSYQRAILSGKKPEDEDDVKSFLETLGNIAAREGDRLTWVLGIDMAHMGVRYGDPMAAEAGEGLMVDVARRDEERIDRANAADAEGFWDLVKENNEDDLKWCGSAPLYTFLRAVPGLRGTTRAYQQWNIDDHSVVSFAAMSFEASR
ncbi:MAG TPA: AmmeMemoRadiSam system protein B [Bryobacteraceae bacterium]|nr:AmmeMemoRadiSam system protein B [Bryobacteraceae bacterium]